MLDRLFDLLVLIWEAIVPYKIINQYDRGVRLRFGKFKEVLEPKLHWKVSSTEPNARDNCR